MEGYVRTTCTYNTFFTFHFENKAQIPTVRTKRKISKGVLFHQLKIEAFEFFCFLGPERLQLDVQFTQYSRDFCTLLAQTMRM